jgi:hypothetical protein
VTYSRPQTSTVNAFAPVAKPNELEAAPRQVVSKTPDGSLRIADLGAGQNSAAELKGFFDGIINVGPKILEPLSVRQATRQVGELTDSVDMQGAVRNGDQATLGMIKRLSPRAQEMLQTSIAATATEDYVQSLARHSALDADLKNPKADIETPEQYHERNARGFARVKQKALGESGLGNVPAEYRGAFAPQLLKGESLVFNGVRSQQDKDYGEYYDNMQGGNLARQARNLGLEEVELRRRELSASPGEAASMKARREQNTSFVAAWYEGVKDKYTPMQAAKVIFQGIKSQYQELIGDKKYDEAMAFLSFMGKALDAKKITTPTGDFLYNMPVAPDGTTLMNSVLVMLSDLEPRREAARAKENYQNIRPLIAPALNGDPNALAEIDKRLPALAENQEQFNLLFDFRGKIKSMSREVTPEQERILLQYKVDYSAEGADTAAINKKLFGDSRLPARLKLDMMQKPGSVDTVTTAVAGARGYNSPQISETVSSLIKGRAEIDPKLRSDSAYLQQVIRDTTNGVIVQATENTEVRLRKLQAEGKPVTAEIANDYFRNELDAVRAARFRQLNSAIPEQRTVQQQRAAELGQIQQNLIKSGGKVSLTTFPKSIVDDAGRNGVPTNDLRKMTEFTLKRIGNIYESDGKTKAFSDPGKEWRQMIKRAQPGGQFADPANDRSSGIDIKQLIEKYVPTIRMTDAIGSAGKPSGTQPAKQSSIYEAGKAIGNGLLNAVVGVIAPPAYASNGPQPVVHEEKMPRLNTLYKDWAGGNPKPIPLREGPLPQVAANMPAAPIPLAIASDKHPFFVAIGINEGTRTANGGYTKNYFGHTDPGDGDRNVGTVSGGGRRGGGGSPQVVDRIWAGRLTQQALSAAPFIASRGVQQGTVGFNRVMFNYLDLFVQANPAAAADFLSKLPRMKQDGLTVESIAKARADSFYLPDGRWAAVWPYPRMLQDQRSRAGTFDYKARLGR